MERAEFRCQWCYAGEEVTLNVHHTYYDKSAAPWEYPSESLLCLCEACHKRAHVMWEEMKRLTSLLASTRFAPELERVIGYAKAVMADYERCYDRPDGFEYNEDEAMGVADFFGFSPHHIMEAKPVKTTATEMRDLANNGGIGYRIRENWERIIKGSAE
jgi:hypothetical protein